MKTKIVLWGSNEKDEKLLIAVELVAKENKVKIYTFPAEETTEEFYNQMMNLWRNDGAVIFPENHEILDKELTVTDTLLPDNLKADRTDILIRAKTEWHFVVLSAKLHAAYQGEIEDFTGKIEQLSRFDSGIWEEMKGFWSKVQSQLREKNLFKEHADELRQNTNELFSKMKELKKALDEEFGQLSGDRAVIFMQKLEVIEKKIEEGLGLQPIFNELKNLQQRFRDTEFTRSDRSKVWKRLDAAFKSVKEKKFGKKATDRSPIDRIMRRYNGLIAAIKKMENSINRDKGEMNFQEKKIETTDGQLEMQIRQAKLAMITERIRSKEEKLNEMLKTKSELEKKIEIEKRKQEKREAAQKNSEEQKAAKAKDNMPVDATPSESEVAQEEIKDKVPAESEAKDEEAKDEEAKDEEAKDEEAKDEEAKDEEAKDEEAKDEEAKDEEAKDEEAKTDESLATAISSTMGEAISDVVVTAKAIAEVVGEKIEDKIESLKSEEEE